MSFRSAVSKPLWGSWSPRAARAAGEGAWVVAGQLLSVAGAFLGLKVLTLFLGKAEYGRLALAMTVQGIASMLIFAAPGQAAIRYLWACREDGTAGSYVLVLRRWYVGAAALVVVGGVIAGLIVQSRVSLEWGWLICLAGTFAAVSGLYTGLSTLHSALRNRRVFALYQVAETWGRTLLASAAVLLLRGSATSAMLGYLGADCTVALFLWRRTFREAWFREAWETRHSRAEWRRLAGSMVGYSAPFVVWALLAASGIYGDRWVVLGVLGSAAVGAYAVLYQIASGPMQLLVGMATQWLGPIIFQRAGALRNRNQAAESLRLIRFSLAATLLIGGVMALGAYTFGHRITAFLTSGSFASDASLLWVFVLGSTLFFVGQNLVTVGMVYRSNWRYVPAYAVQGASIVSLTYLLGTRWGLAGAAAGFCAGNALYAACVGFANRSFSAARVDNALEQA